MIKNTILILSSACLALVIAIFASYYYLKYKESGKEPVVPKGIEKIDPLLGRSVEQNVLEYSSRTGEKLKYQTDTYGSRSSAAFVLGTNECSIVMMGDSRTFGFGVDQEDVWTAKLNQMLSKAKIYNFGVPGYGIDQMQLRFSQDGILVLPKLGFFYVPHFDFQRHMYKERFASPKPYYDVVDGKLVLKMDHMNKAYDQQSAREEMDEMLKRKIPNYEGEFSKEEVWSKAKLIWEKAKEEANNKNIKLIMISGIKDFCEYLKEPDCIFFKTTKQDNIITKDGENLFHINKAANLRMAEFLYQKILDEKWLPQSCF